MKHVIAALYPRALATSLALPMDVLQAAGQAAGIEHRGQSQVKFELASVDRQPVSIVGGLQVMPDLTVDQVTGCDMLLLPGMWRNPQPVLRSQGAWLEVLPALAAALTAATRPDIETELPKVSKLGMFGSVSLASGRIVLAELDAGTRNVTAVAIRSQLRIDPARYIQPPQEDIQLSSSPPIQVYSTQNSIVGSRLCRIAPRGCLGSSC